MNLPMKNNITVKQYRDLPALSYSMLKDFVLKGRQYYYKKYVTKDLPPEEESFDMLMGNLVDVLLFTKDEFDSKYTTSTVAEPKGQMLDFCNILYKNTMKYTEDGVVVRDMSDILMDSYLECAFEGDVAVKFKGKSFEKVLELFRKDGEEYYEELRRNTGKTVISLGTLKRAEDTVDLIKNNFVTYELFTQREDVDIYQQLPIEFKFKGTDMRCLPDHFEVHHKTKIIKPYDLKCTWMVEDFDYNYLKNRYYIQGGLYNEGISQWAKKEGLEDYKVQPMRFIAVDSTGITNPLIHKTSYVDLENSFTGFSVDGRRYMGIIEAIKNIKWCMETGNWNISKDSFDKKGIIPMQIKYD